MSVTVAALSVGTLGVPAMLAAGLASSAHCALMCGALAAGSRRSFDADRLVGRLAAYAVIGAIAGGAGAWLLQAGAWSDAGQGVRLLLLPVVVWLLVRSARARRARPCCEPGARRASKASHVRGVALGFASALLPCPLLLAAAGYAMLSGGAVAGAALLLAFCVGTTPAVQTGAWMWSRAATTLPARAPVLVAGASALALIAAVGAPALIGWCAAG